ncbi:MAG: alpha/beta hydrolase, partial [Symploca sp. SIO1C4]|nr:alpha/beta hydrolase [Symploca sp. SIO1C4]
MGKMSRRKFILQTCATISASLLLKACTRYPAATKNPTNSDLGGQSLSLQFISVPPANSQKPTKLLVCLHGFGANAQDLISIAQLLNLPDYQFLFLEA